MIASVVFCSISCKPLQTDLHAKHDTSVNRSICLQQTANFLRKALFFFITPTVLMVHRKRNHVNKKKTGKRKRWRMVGSRMATRSRYAHWNKTDEEEKLCQNKSPLYGTDLTERHFNTQQLFQVCNKDAQDAACSLLTCGPRERTTASHRSPSTWRTPY